MTIRERKKNVVITKGQVCPYAPDDRRLARRAALVEPVLVGEEEAEAKVAEIRHSDDDTGADGRRDESDALGAAEDGHPGETSTGVRHDEGNNEKYTRWPSG